MPKPFKCFLLVPSLPEYRMKEACISLSGGNRAMLLKSIFPIGLLFHYYVINPTSRILL